MCPLKSPPSRLRITVAPTLPARSLAPITATDDTAIYGYAAAKGAIDVFTMGLAKEVALEGIRVNAVRPGIIDTEIHASGGTPDRVREITPQLPMKRAGTADEVGEAIVWLLSDRSSYTTGSIVEVTGGR